MVSTFKGSMVDASLSEVCFFSLSSSKRRNSSVGSNADPRILRSLSSHGLEDPIILRSRWSCAMKQECVSMTSLPWLEVAQCNLGQCSALLTKLFGDSKTQLITVGTMMNSSKLNGSHPIGGSISASKNTSSLVGSSL